MDFSETVKDFKGTHVGKAAYTGGIFEHATEKIRNFSNLSCHVPLLGIKSVPNIHDLDEPLCCPDSFVPDHSSCSLSESENVYIGKTRKPRAPKCVKQFDDVEKCKRGERIEAISIQEEVEQDLIERNVIIDPDKGVTSCKLPFLVDPESRLVRNDNGALQVFRQQVRKLNANPEDKDAVIKSQQKLQDLGFVEFVSNLSQEDKSLILDSKVKYFVSWRAVWKEGSVTNACRMVFDGSQAMKGGCSLNSMLPKSMNRMNKLVEIMIRCSTWKHAFHTDISKMYNVIRLDKVHWKYQLFLWSDDLMVGDLPLWKVIKTAIYGVRPSGNIAECGLRRTAEPSREVYPKAYDVITYDTYVDNMLRCRWT